jgi:hypothetical protein
MILPLIAAGAALGSLFGGESEASKKARQDQEQQAQRDKMSKTQDQFASKFEAARDKDLQKGRARGEELFKEGTLGRVDANRSADVTDVVSRRRANMAGYTPEEQQALRENNMRNLQQQQAGQTRALRSQQAASGVRGATSAAQQLALAKATQGQATDMERDLYTKGIDMKRAALGDFEKSVTGAEANEVQKQQFNIEAKNKELMSRLATEMGYAQLGSADRSAAAQQASAMYSADAQRAAAAQQGKKK